MKKIVITGGPCDGKTTAESYIRSAFEKLGYRVIFITEASTELILSGITPEKLGQKDYQRAVAELQIHHETVFLRSGGKAVRHGKNAGRMRSRK